MSVRAILVMTVNCTFAAHKFYFSQIVVNELQWFCWIQQHTLSLDLSAKVLLADLAMEHHDVSKFKSKCDNSFIYD